MAMYLLLNTAYFDVLSPQEIASLSRDTSVARFLGKGAAGVMAIGLMLSAYGSVHVGMLSTPRIPYALARDGLLPRWLARLSPRGAPVRAVLLIALLSASITLIGSFDVLTDVYVFVLWVFYGLTIAGLFVLRAKHPDAPRPFRVWGYPLVPLFFLLAAIFLLVNTVIATPGRALAGLGLIALGIPVYAWFASRTTAPPPSAWFSAAA